VSLPFNVAPAVGTTLTEVVQPQTLHTLPEPPSGNPLPPPASKAQLEAPARPPPRLSGWPQATHSSAHTLSVSISTPAN
jgi:hypothetical protein